jgi:hypothetical protein
MMPNPIGRELAAVRASDLAAAAAPRPTRRARRAARRAERSGRGLEGARAVIGLALVSTRVRVLGAGREVR